MRAYLASIRARGGKWVVTRIARKDVDIVVWWKHTMLLLSTEQMNEVGITEGPVWKDGHREQGPYPQMALFLTGFVR